MGLCGFVWLVCLFVVVVVVIGCLWFRFGVGFVVRFGLRGFMVARC